MNRLQPGTTAGTYSQDSIDASRQERAARHTQDWPADHRDDPAPSRAERVAAVLSAARYLTSVILARGAERDVATYQRLGDEVEAATVRLTLAVVAMDTVPQ